MSRERAEALAAFGPVFAVDDTLKAMERLGRRGAGAHGGAHRRGHRLGRQDERQGDAARDADAQCGATHASAASYNNHWGVPLTLARMPADARFGVFEIGMNHAGEITPLVRMVRPHAALITTIAPVHIEYLGSLEAIADAKSEIFLGLEPGGTAILNRDAPQFERLAAAARARGARVLELRLRREGCDARLLGLEDDGAPARASSRADPRARACASISARPARTWRRTRSARCLPPPRSAPISTPRLRRSRASRRRRAGASASRSRRPTGPVTLIDESYNANPASMRAALRLLGATRPGPNGRRIAVIGDMLELGAEGAAMHAALAADLAANHVDLLFGAGPLTRALYDAAPEAMRAAWAERSSALAEEVARALRAGDVAMVKGSNGSRMGPLVAALREHFARPGDGG